MRERHEPQETMPGFIDLETRAPSDLPLRLIKAMADKALVRKIAEPLAGFGGGAVSRVPAHSPDPAPVGVGLNAPGVGKLPRMADVLVEVQAPGLQVLGAAQRVDGKTAVGLVPFAPFRKSLNRGLQSFPLPLLFVLARRGQL